MHRVVPNTRPGRVFIQVMVGLILAGTAVTAAEISWDKPDKRWRSGPVKFLLTKAESKQYKKLKTAEERAEFVKEFWARRDPTPGTPENEYREAFYKRARDAASLYSDDGGRGWQGDRGRVYLLLGPPDETIPGSDLIAGGSTLPGSSGYSPSPATDAPGGGGGPPPPPSRTIKFVYHVNPLTGDGPLELTFRSDVTGGFTLRDRLDWNSPVLRGLAPSAQTKTAAAVTPPAPTPAPPRPPVPANPTPPLIPKPPAPPAAATAPPTPEADLMARVRSAAGPESTLPIEAKIDFYMAADKSTAATITVAVDKGDLPGGVDPGSLIVSAEILDASTGESKQRFFKKKQFGVLDPTPGKMGAVLFQARRSLYPGEYKAIFAVEDPSSGRIGKLEKTIEVPSFDTGSLTLSTITRARALEQVSESTGSKLPVPFVLGHFKVVPRLDSKYKHGEKMIFYYQIYGAKTDEATGKPKLDLSYAFEKKQGNRWIMLGNKPLVLAGKQQPVQAYGLPIHPRYPAGEYRVTIEVTDAVSDKKVTARFPFSVEDAPKTTEAKRK